MPRKFTYNDKIYKSKKSLADELKISVQRLNTKISKGAIVITPIEKIVKPIQDDVKEEIKPDQMPEMKIDEQIETKSSEITTQEAKKKILQKRRLKKMKK